MTSEAKIAANRRNAQKSTGPRTVLGKARSRGNALRHGLSISVRSDPTASKDIAALAEAFLPPDPDETAQRIAALAAEAQLEIVRVRQMRIESLSIDRRGTLKGDTDDTTAVAFARAAPLLSSFDRYESRALSKRKRALRKLRAV